MDQDAAKAFAKSSMACEQPKRRSIDRSRRAIEPIPQGCAQGANPLAIDGFGKDGLRIESGDEGLAAHIVRDIAGGNANGAIGPVYRA